MAIDVIEVQKLYVAYFGRPADPAGLAYWTDALDGRAIALERVAHAFATSPEYRDAYAGLDNRAIVAEVYDHLFGRKAEDAGVDYWAELMDRGVISIDDVVKDISKAAVGADGAAFNGKVAAASAFTLRLDEPHEVAAYAGEAAIRIAMEFLATIKDGESAAEALDPQLVDAWIGRIVEVHPAGALAVELVGQAPLHEAPLPG